MPVRPATGCRRRIQRFPALARPLLTYVCGVQPLFRIDIAAPACSRVQGRLKHDSAELAMISGVRRRLRESPYLRDIAWQLTGNGMAQVLGILTMPILTRLYTPSDFATLNLFVQAATGMAIVLAFRVEYLVMLPKEDTDARQMVRLLGMFGAVVGLVMSVPSWVFRTEVSVWIGVPELAPWLVLAPFTAWLLCMSVALQQAVQRHQNFRHTGLSEVLNKTGYIGTALAGAPWLPQVGGLMLSTPVGLAAKSLWLWRTLHNEHTIPQAVRRGARAIMAPYARLAGAMSYSNLVAMVTTVAPVIYIAKAYGSGALGQFGLVTATLYLPSGLLGNAIGQVFYQRASHAYARGQSFQDLWRGTAWQLLKIGIPLYTAIALTSPLVYPLIFGSSWVDAGWYAMPMSFAAGLSFISSPLDRTSLVVGAWWYQPAWHTLRAATTVCVIQLAQTFSLSMQQFLVALVAQMSAIYVIDWIASRHFAGAHFPHNAPKGT